MGGVVDSSEEGMLGGPVFELQWTAFSLAGQTELTDRLWCLLMLQGRLESQKTFSFAH